MKFKRLKFKNKKFRLSKFSMYLVLFLFLLKNKCIDMLSLLIDELNE